MTATERTKISQYVEVNNLGKGRVNSAIKELGIEIAFELEGQHYSRTIANSDVPVLNSYLKILSAEEKDKLINDEGYSAANKAHEQVGMNRKTFIKFLGILHPGWNEECSGFIEEHNRIAVLPPEYLMAVKRYKELEPQRSILGTWRLLNNRGDFPGKYVRKRNLEKSRRSAKIIYESRRYLKIDEKDIDLLKTFLPMNDAAKYLKEHSYVIKLATTKNRNNRSDSDINEYGLMTAACLLSEEVRLSRDELNARFSNAIWEYVNF